MIYVRNLGDNLYLSADLIKKLNCEYICVLLSANLREIVFASCDKNDDYAIKICNHNQHDNWIEHNIFNKKLCLCLPKKKRIMGKWDKKYKCVIFSFEEGELDFSCYEKEN